ncbi:MAG: peptide deformylase [bacterium]|nr:peptide deformylase [bacterium]
MQIVTVPNPILNIKAKKVTKFNQDLKILVESLKQALNTSKTSGAGLACPQIGVSKRIFVAKKFFTDPIGNDTFVDIIFVNPEIISQSKNTVISFEGCLSIPNTYGKVERAEKITLRYQDENGNLKKLKTENYFARVIQHENDHLDGILFTSKVIGGIIDEKQLDKLIEQERETL